MRSTEAEVRLAMLRMLDAHGSYLSYADEAELIRRAATTDDVGELALRTCLCGERIGGFDAYFTHLREVLATVDVAAS